MLAIALPTAGGQSVALADVVNVHEGVIEQPRYHKDLLPVAFVTGDMAGTIDSPLYAMFAIRSALQEQDAPLQQHYIDQPWLANTRPSSGTASGRSRTKPSVTWALSMRWACC